MKKTNHKDLEANLLGKENLLVRDGMAEKAAQLLLEEC